MVSVIDNYRALYADWHKLHLGKFHLVLMHECTSACRLIPMRVFDCPATGICFNGPRNEFPFIQFDHQTQERAWVQGFGPCHQYKHSGVMHSQRAIWCCFDTGKVHYCEDFCNHRIVTHEGYSVCDLTGTILNEMVVERLPEIPVGAVRSNVAELTSQTIRESASVVDLDKVVDLLGNRSRRSRDGRKVMETVYAGALAFVTQYIEERHNKTIPERIRNQNESVKNQLIAAYRKRKLAAYQKNSHLSPNVDLLQMTLFATYLRQKQTFNICANVPDADRALRARVCATQIVALMAVLRLYIPGGLEFVDRFSTHDFFTIGLEVCRRGLSVRDLADRYDMVLMSQDPLVVLLAEGKSDAAVFWKNKTLKRNTRVKQTMQEAPDAIVMLFQDAVWKHEIDPEQLRIDEISRSVNHIPSEAFEHYKL